MRYYALALTLLLGLTSAAYAQMAGETVRVDEPAAEDLYLAGRWVEITAPVDGDVVAAGQRITIGASVEQDVMAAAENIRITESVGDDVRAVGRRLELSADVEGHLIAAGESVILAPDRSVGSFAWLAGDRIRVDADVGGELRVAAREVVIAGTVNGSARVMAEHIELAPGARIQGDFVWRSENEPTVSPDAVIEGETVARPVPPAEPIGIATAVIAALVALLAVVLVGIVAYLIFPRFTESSAEAIRHRPVTAPALGLAVFAATPVVVLVLLTTGVGALLGLMLLTLYLMGLLLGWLIGAFCTGQWVLRLSGRTEPSRGLQVGALVGAVVVLALLQVIPLLGQLIGLGVLLFGLGGLVLAAVRRYRSPVLEL